MAWHDVTRPLGEGTPVYPGDIVPSFRQEDRGRYRISEIHLSTHSGTHIDAPSHYIAGGAAVHEIPPRVLVGEVTVLPVPGRKTEIGPWDLGGARAERLLFKTWYSGEKTFREDYPGLSLACAEALVQAGTRCVGIDSPSIEPYSGDGAVHRALLSRNTAVIEFLDLSGIAPGIYWMVALPLRLEGLDGSPCRVLLRDPGGGVRDGYRA
ncbi:MAG: cyclase family protein [Methanolinea sp.]|nr:cyclase family protein [Methanolinea sp.]